MRFDLLHNPMGLYLVDCKVELHQISSGWCYADCNLPEICPLYNGAREIAQVHIPQSVRAGKHPVVCYYKNDTVNFVRYA
jgi:hypothetical protein